MRLRRVLLCSFSLYGCFGPPHVLHSCTRRNLLRWRTPTQVCSVQLRASGKTTECTLRIAVRRSVAPPDDTSEFRELLTSGCPTERTSRIAVSCIGRETDARYETGNRCGGRHLLGHVTALRS